MLSKISDKCKGLFKMCTDGDMYKYTDMFKFEGNDIPSYNFTSIISPRNLLI